MSEGDEIGPIGPKLPVIPILSLGGQASNEDYQDHLQRRGEDATFPVFLSSLRSEEMKRFSEWCQLNRLEGHHDDWMRWVSEQSVLESWFRHFPQIL